ncbi:MAG TPA: RHS repeat-associated core domain-containing protein, partial [Ktedonobacteraceae bacterium]|nr:RHS repeat-associated core domain-containing protein [Ktedonobacteraceae bacterium]
IATPSGYVAPDLNQPRTVTSYDALDRSLGTVTYGQGTTIVEESTISYTIAQGVPTLASESSTAYEQTITLDAYQHQAITYTDGLGRTRYTQVFSGTASPYTVVRTVGTTYDPVGNTLSVVTSDSSGSAQATYSATYDGLKRLTGFNDSDLGSCANTPMPADCSGPTDTAWKYTYDADGNILSQTDPRNQSIYTSYDALDRPLCRALSAFDASSCGGSTNAVYFYDGYSNASTPGATFPSGCTAPTGPYASDPVGQTTAEIFIGSSGTGNGWRCYGYDARGQTDQNTLSVTTPDAGTVTQTLNVAYNDGGEVTSLVYPDGETLTSTYDLNGRLQSIFFGTPASTDPVPFLVGKVSYTNNGQIAGMAIGGMAPKASVPTPIFSTATTYDAIQRPLSTSATEAGQTIWSQTRTYDNVGNVLGLSTTVPTQSGGSATENEAFCYDALNRLVWAGNSGTPTGGDHCMAPPSGTTLTSYTQAYSYDALDRLSSGPAGTYSYADANQVHAVTGLSTIPTPYAAYDAMGNMTCRNTDPTSAHTCAGSSPTGALMSYDSRGQLATWSAPSGTVGSAHYLYDNEGEQVLTTSTQNGTPTDTIYFDSYTETVIASGSTTTTRYYSANGQRLAMRVGGATLDYLISDLLGNVVLALNNVGSVIAARLYEPYGSQNYAWGTMPTAHNYTGQRLDSQSGLLYYNFRWYDPVLGQFARTDTIQGNFTGVDPYGYVSDSPEDMVDPTGHLDIAIGEDLAVVGEAGAIGIELGPADFAVMFVVGVFMVVSNVIAPPTEVTTETVASAGTTRSARNSSSNSSSGSWMQAAANAATFGAFSALGMIAGSKLANILAAIDWRGPDQPPTAKGGTARVGAELQAIDDNGNVVAQASSRSQPPDPNDSNKRTCAEYWLCKAFDWQKLKESGVLKVLLKIVSRNGIGPCPQCWAMLTEIAQTYGISISALIYISTRNIPSSVLIDVIENFEQDLLP